MRIFRNRPDNEVRSEERAADASTDTVTITEADRRRDRRADQDGDGRPDNVPDGRADGRMTGDGRPDTAPHAAGAPHLAGAPVAAGAPHAAGPMRTDGDRRVDTDGDGHADTVVHDRPLVDRDGDGVDDADESATATDRRSVVAREKERYGGVKLGSAFFGWLAATGMAVILIALLAAAGTRLILADNTPVEDAANGVAEPETIGVAGVVGLLIILFVSYYCGGYVAGRMARFNGIKQGIAVWVWAVVMAIAVAILAATAGDEFDILAEINGYPRLPLNEGDVTTAGVVAVVLLVAASLLGAVLGGLGGMRFHRAVDKAGLGR